MKVFTTVCTMVALASAESQLLIAQNNVDYLRVPNVGKMRYNGYVDYIDTTGQPLVSNYVLMGQPQVGSVQQYSTAPYTYPMLNMRFKREAEAEATHAQSYKSKVTDPNGGSYELEVQVNRDGEGQSFQHHEQKTTTTNNHQQQQQQQQQQQKRIEEQLYHNMMNARNMDQLQRFNEVMMNDQNRFPGQQRRQQHTVGQQYSRDFTNQNRQNQLLNQLINNQIQNQRTGSFNRFFQLQQQRPTYSHRLINSKNNQQRQQYIREKLNNFGQRKSEQVVQQGGHRMFKREAEPSMMTYRFATSQPTPLMSFDALRNNIYSNMDRRMVYGLRQPVMAIRQAKLNAESMKEIHPEGTMSLRKIYNNDIYQLGRNYGYETMVDLSHH